MIPLFLHRIGCFDCVAFMRCIQMHSNIADRAWLCSWMVCMYLHPCKGKGLFVINKANYFVSLVHRSSGRLFSDPWRLCLWKEENKKRVKDKRKGSECVHTSEGSSSLQDWSRFHNLVVHIAKSGPWSSSSKEFYLYSLSAHTCHETLENWRVCRLESSE